MGNIGPLEIILILVVALLVFGPKRLPEVGRSVGKGLREFRKATSEIRDEFERVGSLEDGPSEDPATTPSTTPSTQPAPSAVPGPPSGSAGTRDPHAGGNGARPGGDPAPE